VDAETCVVGAQDLISTMKVKPPPPDGKFCDFLLLSTDFADFRNVLSWF